MTLEELCGSNSVVGSKGQTKLSRIFPSSTNNDKDELHNEELMMKYQEQVNGAR